MPSELLDFDAELFSRTAAASNTDGNIIWNIILIVERIVIQNRIYNMNLYHYRSTELLTLFSKKNPFYIFDRALNTHVVLIVFFERLEVGAKEIWIEIFR